MFGHRLKIIINSEMSDGLNLCVEDCNVSMEISDYMRPQILLGLMDQFIKLQWKYPP